MIIMTEYSKHSTIFANNFQLVFSIDKSFFPSKQKINFQVFEDKYTNYLLNLLF